MLNIWTPNGNCVGAIPAAAGHFIVMMMVDGRRFDMQPITEYNNVLAKAQSFAATCQRAVKVLPLTFSEALGVMNITEEEFVAGLSPMVVAELRELAIKAGWDGLRESNDPSTREASYQLLVKMGEINS